jgi:hypothetical protein
MIQTKHMFWRGQIAKNPEDLSIWVARCADKSMWYAKRIPCHIKIEKVDREGLWVREGGQYNALNVVKFEDVDEPAW